MPSLFNTLITRLHTLLPNRKYPTRPCITLNCWLVWWPRTESATTIWRCCARCEVVPPSLEPLRFGFRYHWRWGWGYFVHEVQQTWCQFSHLFVNCVEFKRGDILGRELIERMLEVGGTTRKRLPFLAEYFTAGAHMLLRTSMGSTLVRSFRYFW
jgi:hypothetical protein